ncbi:cilia- and flagella-associated protein 276 [Anarrhichthys ocellatus]|uniref:cilia- and flagella-associated protein 276 n=1 Tax=Anarrhichthys ocellatus TaxID=433405 RepID=UPI0012ECC346|nr:protein C1orf194 homolog [Anarrhichthys ocellatus]
MSSRDPFPSPKLQNDFTLSGFRTQRRTTFSKPTHIAQTEEPWSRLHETATLSSSRRSVVNYEPQAPQDSLDLQLKSVYDHHKDFLWLRNQVLYQQGTISRDHRSLLMNFKFLSWQCNLTQDMLDKEQEKDIRVRVALQRCTIYSMK